MIRDVFKYGKMNQIIYINYNKILDYIKDRNWQTSIDLSINNIELLLIDAIVDRM